MQSHTNRIELVSTTKKYKYKTFYRRLSFIARHCILIANSVLRVRDRHNVELLVVDSYQRPAHLPLANQHHPTNMYLEGSRLALIHVVHLTRQEAAHRHQSVAAAVSERALR